MEDTEFFGKSLTPDWKSRRAQQDAYRKALDDQIQERKTIEQSLKSRAKATPQPSAVQDAVKHLMPWLAESTESPKAGKRAAGENNPNNASRNDAHNPIVDFGSADPKPKSQVPEQGQTYFYGPPKSEPQQELRPAGANQPSANASDNNNNNNNNDNFSAPLPHPDNVAYGYYAPSSIPPPPEYTEPSSYRPDYPYKTNDQTQTLPRMPSQQLPPQNNSQVLPASTNSTERAAAGYQKSEEAARSSGFSSTEMSVKRHVSQTSEDTPCETKTQYRDELSRQIEERRQFEEERKRQEKLEEERLQRKVQEDHERMTREYEEEQQRRKAKEDEKRQQENEILQKTREVQRQEEIRRKEEKEEKIRLKEETKKAEASERRKAALLLSTSIENPFDSTPILSSFPIPIITEVGQGDSDMVTKEIDLPKVNVWFEPLNTPKELIASVSIEQDNPPQQKMTSGMSKSAEECNISSSNAETDIPICSKCSRSYSYDDIKLCQEDEQKQLEGVNFLNNLRSVLVAEKEMVDQRIKARKERDDTFSTKIKRFTVQF